MQVLEGLKTMKCTGNDVPAIKSLKALHTQAHNISVVWGAETLAGLPTIEDPTKGIDARKKLRALYDTEIKDEQGGSRLDAISSDLCGP